MKDKLTYKEKFELVAKMLHFYAYSAIGEEYMPGKFRYPVGQLNESGCFEPCNTQQYVIFDATPAREILKKVGYHE